MKALLVIACLSMLAVAAAAGRTADAATMAAFSKPQTNYILGCGGCHGENGVSNSRLVPDLRDQVGYFLRTPQGREYVVRLPNVAFSTMSDQELTDALNYMVFSFGGDSLPVAAAPYTKAEVTRLRRKPLNEVSLLGFRSALIEALIANHGASPRLRIYGGAQY